MRLSRRLFISFAAAGLICSSFGKPLHAGERRFAVQVKNRKVAGDRTIRVTKGDTVIIDWRGDETVDLHLHGYDVKIRVTPGKSTTIRLTARAAGRFPVTLHGGGTGGGSHGESHGKEKTVLYLEVHPD